MSYAVWDRSLSWALALKDFRIIFRAVKFPNNLAGGPAFHGKERCRKHRLIIPSSHFTREYVLRVPQARGVSMGLLLIYRDVPLLPSAAPSGIGTSSGVTRREGKTKRDSSLRLSADRQAQNDSAMGRTAERDRHDGEKQTQRSRKARTVGHPCPLVRSRVL